VSVVGECVGWVCGLNWWSGVCWLAGLGVWVGCLGGVGVWGGCVGCVGRCVGRVCGVGGCGVGVCQLKGWSWLSVCGVVWCVGGVGSLGLVWGRCVGCVG
jgi:hypothetical protein